MRPTFRFHDARRVHLQLGRSAKSACVRLPPVGVASSCSQQSSISKNRESVKTQAKILALTEEPNGSRSWCG